MVRSPRTRILRSVHALRGLLAAGLLVAFAATAEAESVTLVLKDGRVWEGRVFDLGNATLEVCRRGGRRSIAKIEVDRWVWSPGEDPKETADGSPPWLLVLKDGHEIAGTVRYLDGRGEWEVTIPNGGGSAPYPESQVLRVVQPSGLGTDDTFTPRRGFDKRMERAIEGVLSDDRTQQASGREFIERAGYFAVPRIDQALSRKSRHERKISTEAARRLEAVALPERIRLALPVRVLNSIPNIVEVLTTGPTEQRIEVLRTCFLEVGADVYPLLVAVLLDTEQPAEVRGFIVDLMQRTHRVRELVEVYQAATGRAQFAVAVALADAGIYIGLPTLIEALRIEGVSLAIGPKGKPVDVRELSIRKLEEYTGDRLGYDLEANEAAREIAVTKWERWWDEHREQAEQILEYRLNEDPSNPIRERANRFWREGVARWNPPEGETRDSRNIQVAKDLFMQAVETDPTCLAPLVCLGIVAYEGEGDYAAAKEWFRRALRRDHEKGEEELLRLAYYHLGRIAELDLDDDAAEAFYRKAIEIDPEHADTWLDLGNAIFRQALRATDESIDFRRREFERASNAYESGLEKIAEFRSKLVFLTNANLPIGHDLPFSTRDHNRDLKHLKDRLTQAEAEFIYRIARTEFAMKNQDKALEWIDRLIKKELADAKHHRLAAAICEELGRSKDAERHRTIANRLDKGS